MATTNDTTADHATEENQLRLARPQLLGTFGVEGAKGALVRLGSGQTLTLRTGDASPLGTVTAIEPGALHLQKGARARVLRMPS
ncbi:MAG: hypothetical protein AAGF60_07705 [Pseudomonadota bacterium]